MADEDVKDFLTAWDLQQCIAVFEENDIDIRNLPLLKEEMIKELIPSVGHRARFVSNLDDWRVIVSAMPNTSNESNTIINSQTSSSSSTTSSTIVLRDDCSFQTLNLNSDLSQILSTQSVQAEDNKLKPFTNYLQLNELPAKENISSEGASTDVSKAHPSNSELLDLLNSVNEGRALLATYLQSGLLDSIGRKRLCNIIINKKLQDYVNRRVSSSRLHELAFQIITIFPREHSATYFIPYISYGPGLKRSAKGKLLDCLYNRKRDYRKSGLINSSRRSSTSSSSSGYTSPITVRLLNEKEENNAITVEENLKWLRNSSDPWDLVEKYWIATTNTRLKKLMSKDGPTISEYMGEYPCLKKPIGYLLILKDFDVTYPESSDKLFQNLPLLKNRIFDLAKEKIKKSKELTTNELLKEYIQLGTEENEEASIAAFLCLPFLIGVSISKGKRTKTQWRPSKVEMRDGFITHLFSNTEVEETISRRREKLAGFGKTLQPFIIIVGPSLKEIYTYLVVVDNTFYRLNSITASVDCCFKIIIILNAEYPIESEAIWNFIQKGLYKLHTPLDKNFTTVNAFFF
uniref:SAM domain-containing protein n=1 Tax=Sipha flava TaxID=143950 RepID=A0A2S2RA27_9HEMI